MELGEVEVEWRRGEAWRGRGHGAGLLVKARAEVGVEIPAERNASTSRATHSNGHLAGICAQHGRLRGLRARAEMLSRTARQTQGAAREIAPWRRRLAAAHTTNATQRMHGYAWRMGCGGYGHPIVGWQ